MDENWGYPHSRKPPYMSTEKKGRFSWCLWVRLQPEWWGTAQTCWFTWRNGLNISIGCLATEWWNFDQEFLFIPRGNGVCKSNSPDCTKPIVACRPLFVLMQSMIQTWIHQQAATLTTQFAASWGPSRYFRAHIIKVECPSDLPRHGKSAQIPCF